MAPILTHVLDMKLYRPKDDLLAFNSTKGNAPRYIAPLEGGHLKTSSACTTHPSFTADLAPGGADWLRLDTITGIGHLDARMQFRSPTDPSQVFYIRLEGTVKMDDKIRKIFEWDPEAKTTESKDHCNFVVPVFECSKQEDKWLEEKVFVGHGNYVVEDGGKKQAVEYEVYELGSA